MTSRFRGVRLAALAAAVWLALQGAALASTFNVNSTADLVDAALNGVCAAAGGGCTLRAAVMEANNEADFGFDSTIMLSAGTYFLTIPVVGSDGDTEGDLNLRTPSNGFNTQAFIVGAGAATTIIDLGELSRAFDVGVFRRTSISGVTIRNGSVSGANGGAIRSASILEVTASAFDSNEADHGGAISSSNVLFVTNSRFTGNLAQQGGAINVDSSGFVTASEFTLNHAHFGGAVYTAGGGTIVDSLIAMNSAPAAGLGGGVYTAGGSIVIDRSTISGNSAGNGGGILSESNLVVRNSTFSANHAEGDGGGLYLAGAGAASNIYSTSILGNDADSDTAGGGSGGGIFNGNTTINIRNTLVAKNVIAGTPGYDDCTGTIGSFGMNLFTSADSICTIVVVEGNYGYINSTDLIGPLQPNGGPTPTHALLAGSNAIDGSLPAFPCVNESSQPLLTDQRGVTRALGLRCDVGAFEFNEIFRDGFESQNTSHWS